MIVKKNWCREHSSPVRSEGISTIKVFLSRFLTVVTGNGEYHSYVFDDVGTSLKPVLELPYTRKDGNAVIKSPCRHMHLSAFDEDACFHDGDDLGWVPATRPCGVVDAAIMAHGLRFLLWQLAGQWRNLGDETDCGKWCA